MKAIVIAALSAAIIAIDFPIVAQPATGIISGRVTAADTARPLRRARIALRSTGSQMRPISGPSTNAQGRFELKEVPPGIYFVSASRSGYIELQHGQRRPGERGVTVEVKAGQTVSGIDIALPRGSVIAGKITDELGDPYAGTLVIAFVLRYDRGRRVPYPGGFSRTDDLGDYRIPDLVPGSYFISAASTETWRNEKKETLGHTTTFYPGNAPLPQAVTVGVAQERAGIDFSLNAGRTGRVTGRVVRATGEPAAGAPVAMYQAMRGTPYVLAGGAPTSTKTQTDGSFELRDIAPGDYRVRVADQGESVSQSLSVAGDVDNLVLVTRRGSTVTGSIVTEEGGAPPFPASGVRLNLIAPDDELVLPTVRVPAVSNDWTFRLSNVGGPFVFRPVNLPDGWMLDAIKLDDRELTDVAWEVPTGGREIAGLQFVITKQIARIDGSVTTVQGKPTNEATVVIFSEDASHWMPGSRFIRMTRPSGNGQFSIRGLPAGIYLAIAREFIEDGEWENKEFLESARADAVRVTLTRGASETIALRTQD